MSSHSFVRALLVSTALVGAGLATPALAQLAPPAPVRQSIDGNGVDLFLGTINIDAPAISMGGAAPQGLSYYQLYRGSGWTDNIIATLNISGSVATVAFGGTSDSFTISGSTYTSTEGNGATMTLSGSTYTYTAADGTVAHFTNTKVGLAPFYANAGRVTDITRPSGQKLTFTYDSMRYCSSWKPDICMAHLYAYRIGSVRNSYGYAINFSYTLNNEDIDPDTLADSVQLASWGTVVQATMSNLAAGSGSSAPTESFGPVASGGIGYFQVTDAMGRATKYRIGTSPVMGITRPGSTSEDVTFAYTSGRISSVVTAAGTTTYAASDASGVRTVTVTDPLSHTAVYTFDIASQRMTSVTDALSHTTTMAYDTSGRLTRVTKPEGNYVNTTYDARGNVTETRAVAKSGSGLSDIVATASYPSSCTNTATCNEPITTTDARGKVTDYTYDSTTGLVTSVTAPAPTTGATRPQTRYSYTSLQAYYSNGTSIVASGQPVTLLTGTSTCQTGSSCSGTSDEVTTTTSYGPQTTGVGSNLLPVSVSSGAGNGSLTATVTVAYDAVGNVTSIDGPLSGTADTTTYRYDADREKIGAISADPDGSGSMKRRAVRTTYNAHGIATETEVGNVNGTSDTDWAGFTSLQQTTITLDAADRPAVMAVTAGGSTYQVSQQSYDGAGRPECTALRMNSSTWSSLPSSACTLATTGSYGPDRISKTTYDAANRPTQVQTAYGTSDQANETTGTYNSNDTLATLTDAEGNKTSYVYDGVDRLSQTFYPNTTVGSGTSSSTDYEQLSYDASGNVTSRRLRDGNSIGYAYDADGRLTYKDLPTGEYDVTYAYDLLGRVTSSSRTDGVTDTFAWDALGRMLSDAQAFGSMAWQYDLAGRRTRATWGDGFYVNYDYLVTGEVSAVRENGATSGIGILATYAYDDLGRRTSLTRGNGTSSSYGYDNASRATSLGLDLDGSGTSNDLSLGFGYSPANQIASTTRSNNGYAWGAAANRNDASSVNGLNQVTSVGAGSLSYDNKGNISSTGSTTFAYTTENRLSATNSGVSLYYDSLGRLVEYDTSVSTRFIYDGGQMSAEIDNPSGAINKRFVFGPGADEALVEYDKSGGSYTRVWLHADERGSIVAQSNDSGATTAINSYDEYGVPATVNVGRFQYTGQAWLPTLGMYYYKARIYSSRLGRFLQTDPIGYGAGPNWYSYVAGDPINGTDPTGNFGLFGGCPAGSSCTSTNPDAANHAAAVERLESQGFSSGVAEKAVSLVERYGSANAALAATSGSASNRGGVPGEVGDIIVTAHNTIVKAIPVPNRGINPLDPLGVNPVITSLDEVQLAHTMDVIAHGNIATLKPHTYKNYVSPSGAVLPFDPKGYKSFDVNPTSPRGAQRLLIGMSTGLMFYTKNHYNSFFHVTVINP
ncbi:MAG: RHS repeat-associated core domain-containing protein [Sphingomonas sp.]|jgi:RHS repeat-associated protein|uniref:RHS repeat-associated core domain-containing protein n=1 Tax=Sphingomonas sp. TaxID=28214 RepID=UPI003566CEF3